MSDTTDTTNNTDTNTDTTDEPTPTKDELHERVNRLESLIERMLPSRRGVLGGLAAVLGGTYLGSQTVESSTGSAGQIGTTSDRPDIFADTLDFNSAAGSGFDVTGEIDGQQITPSQTGTSTNPTTVVADSVTEDGNNVVTSPNADRDIFVIASGASDPSAADADDIILEKK